LEYIYGMKLLKTPLTESDVAALRVGDVVYLSGIIYTARDGAHARALAENRFPEDVSGGVIFHAGPIVRKSGKGWRMVAVGPTTSARMDSLEPEFIKRFGVRAIVGKGGMGKGVSAALRESGAVYLSMCGGCAASGAEKVTSVLGVHWLDLGVPEAVWALKVNKLGPLIVSMDSCGRSLYEEVEKNLSSKKA
jgi:fumarate hydratase subunit beta